MNQEKIGKFILDLRKQNKMTQKELADKLNVTAQAVSKWENGRGIPDIEILQKISTEFNVNIESILNGEKNKKKMPIKYILIILLVIILLGVAIYLLLNSSDYNFTDIKSTSNNFNVNGVAAYSSDKNSIYISKIEYLDGDEEEKYVGMECTLYESHDNLEEKVSQCGSLKEEKQTPKTLSELLKETEFKVENFSCTSKNIKNSNLYISINVLDTEGKITTYKVPLVLTGSCN
ncbi:MAG: helix-turn-helix transcriptional regulator [Candidatus Faecimonas sp.]|nr:helix-turn-helix domain-containing protein [Mycoplasmatota bacterium]MDY2908372.1 helix-turn-helix transcriptional regulator [Candidatus Faecimonas sp.]